ncbi:MAG: orotidine-5'-phosphate decarboxylase [Candidatus Marinimicrobia bacterium]|nr:orotidine-5'-phosphate decarboxylase [Candidatus Neomarinimicrobiota bacterium]
MPVRVPFYNRITAEISAKGSSLCLGLDLDLRRESPLHGSSFSGLRDASLAIVDATADLVWGYKLNFAFFEQHGSRGLRWLEELRGAIGSRAVVIGDGKRGDIGSSAQRYADALFGHLDLDAVTVSPYMGHDSIEPFADDPTRGAFILCLTSNPGSADFQQQPPDDPLYLRVARWAAKHNSHGNLGLVVGATRSGDMAAIREAAPALPFLVPGIGSQGGNIEAAMSAHRPEAPVIATVARSILYHGAGTLEDIRRAVTEFNRMLDGARP